MQSVSALASDEYGEERADDEEGALQRREEEAGVSSVLLETESCTRASRLAERKRERVRATHREEVPADREAERARHRSAVGREHDALHRDARRRRLERVLGERLVVLDDRRRVEQLRERPRHQISNSSHRCAESSRARAGTHLKDVLLADELLALPPSQEAELGPDEADLARAAPHDRRRARERDELVELDERALERALNEGLRAR